MTKTTSIAAIFCALYLPIAPAADANADSTWNRTCSAQTLTSFWEENVGGNALSGRGAICATSDGLWSTLSVRGLTPGNAYTTWWVYIDDPSSCANLPLTPDNSPVPFDEPVGYAGRCGLADFFSEDASGEFLNPLAVFGRMDSVVARTSQQTHFAGNLRSFAPTPGAQVWMFVFGHGPADTSDKRQLARQLLTPEDPGSGTPHLGIAGRPFGYPAAVVAVELWSKP